MAVAVAIIVAGVVAGVVSLGEANAPVEQPRLAGAELMAGPGGDEQRPSDGDRLVDLRLGGSRWDDFRAYDLRAGSDGTLYLLTGWEDCDIEDCYGFVSRIDDDMVVEGSSRYGGGYPGQLAIAPDRRAARLSSNSALYDFNPRHESDRLSEVGFALLSGGYTADGTLVASATGEPRIVAIRPDRTVDNLLVPTNSTEAAPVRFESDTASLSVVVLPDGRIAFAANAPDDPDLDGRVFLLADDSLQPLELPDADPIRRIFPGPAGTLLALEGPHISQVDPATATVERLIDLSEVADELAPASDEWPPVQNISATAHGDDLIFTAEYQLWRLRDAFG